MSVTNTIISDIKIPYTSLTVGLLLSVSEVWPDDRPSSSTGIDEYRDAPVVPRRAGCGGGSTARRDDASLSQLESQSVVSGDKVKLRECLCISPPTSISKSSVESSQLDCYKQMYIHI